MIPYTKLTKTDVKYNDEKGTAFTQFKALY